MTILKNAFGLVLLLALCPRQSVGMFIWAETMMHWVSNSKTRIAVHVSFTKEFNIFVRKQFFVMVEIFLNLFCTHTHTFEICIL